MSFDFNLKEISYKTDNFDSSQLELEIKGSDVHYSIINSLRKVCLNQIPIYAIPPQKINILRKSYSSNG
jgi:DNA-directed RNA polymerase alpha subunit